MLNTITRVGSQALAGQVNYDLVSHNVHHLILTTRSHQVVQDWRHQMSSVYRQGSYETVLTLTDARRTTLPALSYAIYLSDLWLNHRFDRVFSRNAIIHPDAPLTAIADDVLRALPGYGNHIVRFFAPSARTEAIRWLVSND